MDNKANTYNRVRGGVHLLFSSPKRHLTQQFGDGGKVTVLEKSRKSKLRNLESVGDSRMGQVGSDGEDELLLSSGSAGCTKRLKYPKKFFDECSTVCHVSVPRKLRSAIKKRCRESVSPPLPPVRKKLNHVVGVGSVKKDGSLKSKLKMKQGEAEGCVTDGSQWLVTKDELEVAEALCALSGAFTSAVKADKHRSSANCQGWEANSSTLTKDESSVSPLDAEGKVEEEHKTASSGDEALEHSSNAVGSAGDTFILHCSNDTTEPNISISKQPSIELGSIIPEVNLSSTASLSENQFTIQKPIHGAVVSGASTELSMTRSNLLNLDKSPARIKYPVMSEAQIEAACSQTEVQHTIKETRNDGSSMRPDLFSATSCDSQGLGIPLPSPITNLPARFGNTICSALSPELKSSAIAKKEAQVAINSKNSWKRCCAHVYISRFIEVFQNTKGKNMLPMKSTKLTTNEAPERAANINAVDLTGERNVLIGVVSSDSFSDLASEKNVTEVRNAILLHKRLVQDLQQTSRLYEVYTPGNQLMQMQMQMQMPPYFGSTSYGPTTLIMDAATSSAQQLEQQQQKRSSLLMAHYKSGVASPTAPNKQAGGPDLPPVFQHVQTLLPPSISSLQVLGPRCAPVLQQQQQIISPNSVLHSPTVNGQYHHRPSVYEANVAGVRLNNVPLEMICSQHI